LYSALISAQIIENNSNGERPKISMNTTSRCVVHLTEA
jgi:hypothetical protein